MAGGVGSRFWPGSREAHPKQFLDMLNVGKSLLRLTFERFLPICPVENIFIVTNAAYKDLVKKHLPEISDHQILCEPSRNNTAPCVAYTAFKLASLDPDANFVVAPSDHIVLKETIFQEKIQQALDFSAKNEAIVTLGMKPNRPDTGYGYIQFGNRIGNSDIHRVSRFTEKPNLETAETFLASGEYLWNAGIFIWHSKTILKAFEEHAPEISRILSGGNQYYNTISEQKFINEHYPQTPNISVDFAILEKAKNVFTIPSEFGWSDLGTWASLYEECPKDERGNVIQAEKYMLKNVENCLLQTSPNKLLVVRDLEGFIVVDKEDVLMIWPKNQEQAIKNLTNEAKIEFGDLYF